MAPCAECGTMPSGRDDWLRHRSPTVLAAAQSRLPERSADSPNLLNPAVPPDRLNSHDRFSGDIPARTRMTECEIYYSSCISVILHWSDKGRLSQFSTYVSLVIITLPAGTKSPTPPANPRPQRWPLPSEGHSVMMKWCLVSSDVRWHIRDKLRPMPKHGSINLYVHGSQKAR